MTPKVPRENPFFLLPAMPQLAASTSRQRTTARPRPLPVTRSTEGAMQMPIADRRMPIDGSRLAPAARQPLPSLGTPHAAPPPSCLSLVPAARWQDGQDGRARPWEELCFSSPLEDKMCTRRHLGPEKPVRTGNGLRQVVTAGNWPLPAVASGAQSLPLGTGREGDGGGRLVGARPCRGSTGQAAPRVLVGSRPLRWAASCRAEGERWREADRPGN